MGAGEARGPQPRRQAVVACVRALCDFLERLVRRGHEHGAEDLLARDAQVVALAREERGSDEVAAAVGERGIASHHQLGPLLAARLDVAHHAVALLGRHQRSQLGGRVEPRSKLSGLGLLGQSADHLVEARRGDEQARPRVAGLAGVEVDRLVGALHGSLNVGVGQDDVGRLAPELQRDALERAPGLGADLAPHLGRAGEGDLLDAGVVDERRTGLPVAGDHVEHARRQPNLERQFAEAQRAQRRLLGGLEHDRAARRQRRRDLPGGHQQGKVPRHDLPAHADRFTARVAVHVGRGDGEHAALDLRRPAGEVADVRGRPAHVDEAREARRLAIVERLDLGELLVVRFDRVGERHHQPLTPGRGHRGPRTVGEGGARGGDGTVDVLGAGVGYLRDLAPGGRVERGKSAPVGGGDALPADQQQLRAGYECARRVPQRVGECGGGGGVGCGGHGGSLCVRVSARS